MESKKKLGVASVVGEVANEQTARELVCFMGATGRHSYDFSYRDKDISGIMKEMRRKSGLPSAADEQIAGRLIRSNYMDTGHPVTFNYHAKNTRGLVQSLCRSLGIPDIYYNEKLNKRRRRCNRIKRAHKNWYKSHRFISKETKELLDKTAFIVQKTPGGWGGTYELYLVTTDGEVHRADKTDIYNRNIKQLSLYGAVREVKFGLFTYSKLGMIEEVLMGQLKNVNVLNTTTLEFRGFDAPSFIALKKTKHGYRNMALLGNTEELSIKRVDLEYIENLQREINRVESAGVYND